MMAYGTVGLKPSLLAQKTTATSPFNTMHMWFIYYLIWFCVFTAALAPLWSRTPAGLRAGVDAAFRALAGNWWGPLLLAMPLAFIGSFYRAGMLAVSGSFILNLPEVLHHGLFFVFGLLAYRHRDTLFARFEQTCWRNTAAGAGIFVVVLGLFNSFLKQPGTVPHIEVWIAFAYNLTSWLWSFALIGLFLRYLPNQRGVLRYVSESSYWVFLVHMLGTIGFGALVYSLPVGAFAKIILNIAATTAVCLLSYQLCVRHTFIGVLLNGKRQEKAEPAVVPLAPGQA
jgi:hypothetical protein